MQRFDATNSNLHSGYLQGHAMKIKNIGIALVLSVTGLWATWNLGFVSAAGNAPLALFTGNVSAVEPLTGGMVFVTDSSTPARKFTAPVLANGIYALNAARGVAPFLFHVRGQEGSRTVELFSASAASSGTVNISPLTSLVVASAAGRDCAATADCEPSTFTSAKLSEATAKVHSQMVMLLTQFALAIADKLDPREHDPESARKWLYFKHIAVGGFIYARDGPLEFVKDDATGNWRIAGGQQPANTAKKGKSSITYAPLPGASSLGKWLTFATDSPSYPDGATLIAVSSTSIIPPVTLVYTGPDNGAVNLSGSEMVKAVSNKSFLPACPRAAGAGPCVDVAQISSGGIYTATINDSPDGDSALALGESSRNMNR